MKSSYVWVNPDCFIELSCWSLWGENFYWFYTITIWSRWFTWNYPSMVLVFYRSTHPFSLLYIYCLFMINLISVTFSFVTIKYFSCFLVIEWQLRIEVYLKFRFVFNIIKLLTIIYEYQIRLVIYWYLNVFWSKSNQVLYTEPLKYVYC